MPSTDPKAPRSGRSAFRALIKDLISFAGRRGVLAATYIALGAVFESFSIVLIVPLLALVIGGGNVGGNGLLHRVPADIFAAFSITTRFGRLALLMGGFAALMVIRGIVVSLRDNTVFTLQNDFIENLRSRITGSLADAGWDRVLRLRHARVLNMMSGDIQRISSASQYMLQATIGAFILLAQCVLSFILAPGLSLLAFAMLITGAVVMIPVLRRARALGQYVTGANLSLIDTTAQFLNGLKLAFSQDLQYRFVSEFRDTMRGLKSRQYRYFRQQTAGRVALSTLSALVGAAVMLVGYGLMNLNPAVLITFLLVIGRMSGPATQIQQGFQQLAFGLPAYEATMDLMDELRRSTPQKDAPPLPVPEGPIVLDRVVFIHPYAEGGESQGVHQASLRIAPGEFLGLGGSSGAGKTTLVDLLVGLLRPQAGIMSVGGVPIDDATLPAWRAQLSYISQDPFLFHDTVRRNLLWARPDASEADIWEALTLAGADDIVRRMDHSLDTVVGERGSLVSGGERQRIALARAILRRPRLLVMDEATNAIDIAGERALLERLLALRPKPTILMIAHRAESLALCDRVVFMQDGRLLEA